MTTILHQIPQTLIRESIQESIFSEAASALWGGKSISVEGIVGSSTALAIVALFQHGNGTIVVITPNADSAEQIAEDITLFLEPENRQNVFLVPPMVQHDHESETALAIADEAFGERLNILKRLADSTDSRFVVVVSMPALLQPAPPPALLMERTQMLTVNSCVDLQALCRLQPNECIGASLLDYFSSSTPIVLVEPAAIKC